LAGKETNMDEDKTVKQETTNGEAPKATAAAGTPQPPGPPAVSAAPTSTALMPPMSSEAFATRLDPNGFAELSRFASIIAKAGMVKTAEDAFARIAAGASLGLPAMTAIRQLFFVDGKLGMEASLAHAMCLRSPLCEYFEHVETTDDHSTFKTKRRGRPEKVHTFDVKQAEAAGLFDRGDKKDKNNWNRWLHQMLEARCKMQLGRLVYPDILGGIYSREEYAAGDVLEVSLESQVVADTGQQAVVAESVKNYDQEIADFKAKADKAATKGDFQELRKMIEAADWPAGHKQQASDIYGAAVKRAKEAKPATVPAPAAEATREPGVD
jgi:hypothetical protein